MERLGLSGDSRRIAVVTRRDLALNEDDNLQPTTWKLEVIDVATGEVITILTARETERLEPFWFSPDGGRVLFHRGEEPGEGSLWSAGSDGSDLRLIVANVAKGHWQPLP